MSFANTLPTTPKTGQFGAIYLLRGTSAPFTGAILAPKNAQPRNSRIFAPGTLWGLVDRTKKIIDPAILDTAFVVKNNGVIVQPANYQHLGGGDILFNTPPTLSGNTAEAQTLTITGAPTSAQIPLQVGGMSNTLSYAAGTTAAQVKAALEALPTVGAGGSNVAGSAGGPYTITWAGANAGGPQPLIGVAGASFVGGTNPAVATAETVPGVSTITLDAAAIPTGGAYDQLQCVETVDWKMAPTAAMVTNNVYGRVAGRKFPSFVDTTFSFVQNSVDNTFFNFAVTGQLITLAGYESTKSVPPSIWVLSGYVGAAPVDATGNGMVGGTKTFDTIQLPYYIQETL